MIRACKCFGKVFQSHKGLRFNPLLSDDELYCAGVSVVTPLLLNMLGHLTITPNVVVVFI